jgi:hypothetical protein
MRLVRVWVAPLLIVAAMAGADRIAAQEVDVSGAWQLRVTTDQGTTHPTVVFEQAGTMLTGDYASETLGRNDVEGEVDGHNVHWSFSTSLQGQSFPVRYEGTLRDDGTIAGSIDVAGGMVTGSFVATRDDGGADAEGHRQ